MLPRQLKLKKVRNHKRTKQFSLERPLLKLKLDTNILINIILQAHTWIILFIEKKIKLRSVWQIYNKDLICCELIFVIFAAITLFHIITHIVVLKVNEIFVHV